MTKRSYEQRYQSYLELLRDYTPTTVELGAIERQIERLNHDMEHAPLYPARRLALLDLRNETMTALGAAQHRARIDDARRASALAGLIDRQAAEERRRAGRPSSLTASTRLRPPPRQRYRGIER